MNCKPNVGWLGLVAVVVLAMLPAGASAAVFHSEVTHTVLSGSQVGTASVSGDPGTITCKKATANGTATGTTTSAVTIFGEASECTLATIFGNISVTVNTNGCDSLITADGTLHGQCPAGKNVVVSGPGCTITIPAQTGGTADYVNQGSGSSRHLTIVSTGKGIQYSYSGFTCGSGTGTSNGTATGTATVIGKDSLGKQVGIWFE
jgi:hypothetical protein